MIDSAAIKMRFAALSPLLDERGRRRFAAAEALAAGRGGIAAVSRATGIARSTIGYGLREMRGHAIDYHHLIGTLRRKPQALRYLVYREALFPRAAYARAWAALDAALPPRDACRTMVGLLVLASTREAIEIALADRLDAILDAGKLPDMANLAKEAKPPAQKSGSSRILVGDFGVIS